MFSGDPAPFVIELPAYHLPSIKGVLRTMLERAWAYVKRAGTVVLVSTIVIWALQNFDWHFDMVDTNESILASIGGVFAWIFHPLGFGDWRAAVASVTGLIAKENLVGTFGVLYGFAEVAEDGTEFWPQLAAAYTPVAGYSLMIFNMLCVPCMAAVGAMRREMMSKKYTWFAIAYQCGLAYCVALMINQIGSLIAYGTNYASYNIVSVIAAFLVLACFIYLLFFKKRYSPEQDKAKKMKETVTKEA